MKKEVAMSRIKKAVERACPTESQQVKDYLVDLTYETFKGLELDYNACHDDGRPYTSTENLEYALSINLEDELGSLLEEARRETAVLHESVVGYYGVKFFDDDGNCKNHWLNEEQTMFFRDRERAVAYIDEVSSWNAISFTQTLIYKVK